MPEPVPSAAEPTGWRAHWPAAALAVLAALVALWARHRLFPAYSWNRDEPVYLWHVDLLRAGQLTATDGGHPSLFQPWLSARGDGVIFTQYTLGWPLVLLAAAVLTGSAGNALLVGAALAVLGTYALGLEVLRDRRIATVGAALMVASPILAIQGGVYLSYLFTLGLGLLAGTLLLSGVRLRRNGRLVAAGLLLGWVFLTRPYDAVLWGVAFGAYALVLERGGWRALVRPAVVVAAAALPLVIATLAYNRHVTGGWLEFPITAADPMDTFGFGPRRLMPTFEVTDYDLGAALKATAKNAFLLPWFLVGSYAGLALAAVGLWRGRRERSTLALVLVGAVFPLGYFVFWGNHLSSLAARISGPIYFVPLYAPICLLVAAVLVGLWPHQRRLAVAALAALVVGTVPAAVSRFDANRDLSVRQAAWRDSVADVEGRALVFVADTAPYLLYLNPFSSNGPELDDRILYAADTDAAMLDLIAELPDRTPYLQQATIAAQELGPREDPYDVAVSLTPIEVARGTALDVRVEVAATDASHVAITVEGGATPRTDRLRGGAGQTVTLHLTSTAAGGDTIALAGAGALVVTAGYGETAAEAASEPAVRQLIYFRVVDGEIEVLLPTAAQRLEVVDDVPQWRRAVANPELTVTVSPAPLGP
jgi:hypothetical protein